MLLAFFAVTVHCWLMHSSLCTRTFRVFSAQPLPNPSVPSSYWCQGLLIPNSGLGIHLFFISIFSIRILLAVLPRRWSPWTTALFLSISTIFSNLGKSASFTSICSVGSLRDEKLKQDRPQNRHKWQSRLQAPRLSETLTPACWAWPTHQILRHLAARPSRPQLPNLDTKTLWVTVSRALLQSRQMTSTALLLLFPDRRQSGQSCRINPKCHLYYIYNSINNYLPLHFE